MRLVFLALLLGLFGLSHAADYRPLVLGSNNQPVQLPTGSTLFCPVTSGADASKPAAASSNVGQVYWATDTVKLYRSDGSTWTALPGSGGGGTTPTGTGFTHITSGAQDSAAKTVDTADITALAVTGAKIAASTIDLTTKVTGTLPVGSGGTNSATALSGSSIIISNGSSLVQGAAGTTSTLLHGNASGAPSFSAVALGSEVSGTLPVGSGGTGQTSTGAAFQALSPITTIGDFIVGGASGVPQRLAGNTTTAKQFVTSTGDGTNAALPVLGVIAAGDLPNHSTALLTSGTLGVARGGTGSGTAPSTGQIPVGNSGGTAYAPVSVSGDATMDNTGALTIANLAITNAKIAASTINLTTKVTGTLPIANGGTNSAAALTGSGAIMITNGTSIIQGNSGTTVQVLHGNASGTPAYGAVALGTDVSGQLPIANGGTGQATANAGFNALSPLTTLGDIIYGGASGAATRLAGNTTTTHQFLTSTGSGGLATAPSFGALQAGDIPNLPTSILTTGQLGAGLGGTGFDGSLAANGSLPIGTGSGFANATLTPGANVSIANGSGTITISASGLTTVADANYTALITDKTISYTSITAARTVTLPQASTASLGQWMEVNDASGSVTATFTITITGFAGDTIEGGTVPWVIRNAGGYRRFYKASSTNWKLVAMSTDVQSFATAGSFTWNKEPGAREGFSEGIGGGGGGGSGAVEASGTAACGGGGGGGGGYSFRRFNISDASATETVVVGAAGTSGAAQASSTSNGNAGGSGGDSSFGTSQLIVMKARGGGGGAGGTTATGVAGLPGGGVTSGVLGSTAGAAGAAGNNLGNIPSGNSGGGGAGAGGITTAGTPFQNGGFGGPGSIYRTDWGNAGSQGNSRGAADAASGGSPTDGTAGAVVGGPGGGGAASSILTNGGTGGTGAKYGGGGGGGGAALNTHSSGAGGAGGAGIVVVRQSY